MKRRNARLRILAGVLTVNVTVCAAAGPAQVYLDARLREYRPVIVTSGHLVSFDHSGSFDLFDFASASASGRIRVDGSGGPVLAAAASPNSTGLLTLSADRALRFWDTSSGRPLQWVEPATRDRLIYAAVSLDGRVAVTLSESGRIQLRPLPFGNQLTSRSWTSLADSSAGAISALRFCAENILLIGTTRGAIYRWSAEERRATILRDASDSPIVALAVAAESKRFAAADGRGVIYIGHFDAADVREFARLEQSVRTLDTDARGEVLIACTSGANAGTGAHLDVGTLPCARVSPTGQAVWSVDAAGNLNEWRVSIDTDGQIALNPAVNFMQRGWSGADEVFSNVRTTAFGLFQAFRIVPTVLNGAESYASPRMTALRSPLLGFADGRVVMGGSGQQPSAYTVSDSPITALAFDASSKLIAAADAKCRITLVKTKSDEITQVLSLSERIFDLRFSLRNPKVLLAYTASGVTVLDLDRNRVLGAITVLPGLSGWVVLSQHGLFDGPSVFWDFVRVRSTPSEPGVPLSSMIEDFYTPQLLPALLEGRSLVAAQDVNTIDRRTPVVKLGAARLRAGPGASDWLVVSLEATEVAPDGSARRGSGVRDLRLFRNGVLVRTWRGDLPLEQGRFEARTALRVSDGVQRLSAYAFNRSNVKGFDTHLEVTIETDSSRPKTLHVLAVGVSRYERSELSLRFAHTDAISFAAAITDSIQTTGQFQRVSNYLLLNEDATRRNILLALRRLAGGPRPIAGSLLPPVLQDIEVPGPDDAVMVYYSGHADVVGGQYRLLPHDTRIKVVNGTVLADEQSGISQEEFAQALERVDGADFVLVVDACYSGQLLTSADRRAPVSARGFAQLAFNKGMSVIVASTSQQVAVESDVLGHGDLTFALIREGLTTLDADQSPADGVVSVREWLEWSARRVPELHQGGIHRGLSLDITEGSIDPVARNVDSKTPYRQQPLVFFGGETTKPFAIRKIR